MGKYIRKGKLTAGEVGPDHHHHQTRARTKTLAVVQKPKPRSKPDPKPALFSDSDLSELCYLQLRSRRLTRRNFAPKASKAKGSPSGSKGKAGGGADVEVEAEVGENVVEFEVGVKSNRSSRETTPCSLIKRDCDPIRTPGSTTRQTTTSATNWMIQSPPRRNLPTSHLPTSREMDEFFSVAEKRQQKAFKERYNFDPVKGRPLPGRFEWIKLKSSGISSPLPSLC